MGKMKKLLLSVGIPTIVAGTIGLGILGVGFITMVSGASAYQIFYGEKELTEEEKLNLNTYGCACGDCSGGVTYLGGNIITDSSSGELLGGDYSSTHSGDSIAFNSELIPGLSAEQDANAKEIYVWFRNNGYSHAAAIGIMGNMWQESGFYYIIWSGGKKVTFDSKPSSATYYGLVQTNYEAITDNWIPYLNGLNKSVDTLDGQLSALDYSLSSGNEKGCFSTYPDSEYKISFSEFKALEDSELACDYFCTSYERCVGGSDKAITKTSKLYQHLKNRKNYAAILENYFKNNVTVKDNTSSSTGNSSGSTSITTTSGGITIPSRGQLDSSRGEYGIPVWTGYSMDDNENTVVIPVETDTRIETKIATKTQDTFASDTKTVAERGEDAVASTEHVRTSGQCDLDNGRLKVAVASGLIAWDKNPDCDDSMKGVLIDVVLKDGTVIPCVVADAKANVHSGDLHMFYAGGYGRSSFGEDYWLQADYSFIEIYGAHCVDTGKRTADGDIIWSFVSSSWLTKFSREAGGISHIKVYNHQNKSYALANNAIESGQQPTTSSSTAIPQPGNGSTTSSVKSSVKLTYGVENVDIDGWTPGTVLEREYDITECKPITVNQHLLPESNSKPFTGEIDSLVVHYWGTGGNSGDNIYSTFTGNGYSSNFSIGNDGVLWQFVSLDRAAFANNVNTNRLSIEVSNLNNGLKNYNKEAYETLIHLTAWLAVKYNLSTDFDWQYNYKNNQQLNMYRDMGNIRRHYDNQMSEKSAYTNYFRGKTCPAYWVPKDGSSESDGLATAGGNARWIAFKEAVTEYIIKYKDDPNFEIEGVAGTESIDKYKRNVSNANWSNGYVYESTSNSGSATVGGYIGTNCGCSIPCSKCDCHDDEWEAIKNGQSLDGNISNSSSGNSSYANGVTDGVQLSGPTARERGLDTLEGTLYTIENGVLTWIGSDWNSTVFLSAARSLMIKMCNMNLDYGSVLVDVDGVGIMRTDCSGYVSQVLKQMGYGNTGFEDSQENWSKLEFQKITSEDDLQPGDIIQFTNSNHTNIFCGWIDQSKRQMATYDFGDKHWDKEGPNYYEPMSYTPSAKKAFVAAWRPVPIDTTIDGKTYTASGTASSSSSSTTSSESASTSNKSAKAGTVLSSSDLSFNSSDYFWTKEITVGDSVYNRIYGKSFPDSDDAQISLSDLRYVQVLHYNFDGNVQVGELIVNANIANGVINAFKELFNNQYQIERMVLIDEYWDSNGLSTLDTNSMSDNNSSAFCYRLKTSGNSLSEHSFGYAIDINPKQNPYVYKDGSGTEPPDSTRYAARIDDPDTEEVETKHMIFKNDVCYNAFMNNGFNRWGGDYSSSKDYQHFEWVEDP